MKFFVGDIGNTATKLCIVDRKKYNIIKVFNLETKKINSKSYLVKFFRKNKFFINKSISKTALFGHFLQKSFLICKENIFSGHR